MKKTLLTLFLLLLAFELIQRVASSQTGTQSGSESPALAAAGGESGEQVTPEPTSQANPPHLANFVCAFDVVGVWTVSFTIQGGSADVPYGVFRTLDLSQTVPSWQLLVPYRKNPVQEAQDLWMLTRSRWPAQARSGVPST